MNINPLDSSGAGGGGTNPASTSGTDQIFLQLLVAQLKNQTPLDPVDPNQFASQLVQFNMLDELVQIRDLLAQATAPPDASANANSIQGAK